MPRIVVVGAGISGLAAAWVARRAGLDVTVFERDAEVGGKARSIARDGWLVEGGPSSFLARPGMDQLVDEARMRGEVLTARPAAKRRFIYVKGEMREIVPHPLKFFRSGLLSARGGARILAEPFVPRFHGGDETVWDFAARRLGREFADRLIMPMTLGVFAGDARALSVDAAFPRMRALEREHGSLICGLIAGGGKMTGSLSSFRGGMQALPRALAQRGGFEVRLNASVQSIERANDRWLVHTDARESLVADALVLSGEPCAMADLVHPHAPAAAADLRAIRCPPVSVVALGYDVRAAARVPLGFGALIARGEGYRALGHLWETHIFAGRGPEGAVLVRAMYGGSVDERAGALEGVELLALACAEVEQLYGMSEPPVFTLVQRWPRAIPQYELGHLARVARIGRAIAALPNVWISGNGLRGVSFGDAATDGARTGEAVAAALRQP